MWNPLEKLKQKFTGVSDTATPKPEDAALAAAAAGGAPDMKELEKKGMLGQFLRRWKDPAFLRQIRAVAARMQADGVNVKDQAAVKAWIESHQKEIMSGQLQPPAGVEPQKTYVKTEPALGRNEPCKCGSMKKFKKCCGKSA